jgi:peptidoglycan/xylan/chitin deacetylase (PgdA/CDA1 family)
MTTIRRACAVLFIVIAAGMAANAYGQSSASVLCYHAFLEKKRDNFCFTLDELNSHITQLRKEGFMFVSVDDIISGRAAGTKNVLITVDDGNKSVYEAHKKVFKPNGIRPLLGIYPNIIGKKNYALTWEQLIELAGDGCDIAAHGYYHLKINQRLFDDHPAYFRKEIYGSKKVLEEKLNRKVSIFVYPFGLRTEVATRALKEAGYRYAFTIDRGKINMPLEYKEGNLQLPRYMVTRTGWKYCFNSVVRNSRSKIPVKFARIVEENNDNKDLALAEPVSTRRPAHVEKTVQQPAEKPSLVVEGPVTPKRSAKADRNAVDHISYERPRDIHDRSRGANGTAALTVQTKTIPMESSLFNFRGGQADSQEKQSNVSIALEAKTGKDVKGYRADVKKNYYKLTHESYMTYNRFMGLVRGKIDRLKRQVKQYLVSHL